MGAPELCRNLPPRAIGTPPRGPSASLIGPNIRRAAPRRWITLSTQPAKLSLQFLDALPPLALSDGGLLTLTGRAAWAINGGTDRNVGAAFQSLPGTAFTIDGAEPDRNALLLDAGAGYRAPSGLLRRRYLRGRVLRQRAELRRQGEGRLQLVGKN